MGGGQQRFLPPVGIRAVVIVKGQTAEQVDIVRKFQLTGQLFCQRLFIIGGIAVGLRQKMILVGNYRKIYVRVRSGHQRFIEIAEPLRCVCQRCLLQRVIQFGGVAAGKINAVVVLLTVAVKARQGLQGAELLPQGKLVNGIAFVVGHEPPGEHACRSHLRSLGERAPLADRQCIRRLYRRPAAKPKDEGTQKRQGDDVLHIFHGASSKAEIQKGIEGTVHQIPGTNRQQSQQYHRLQCGDYPPGDASPGKLPDNDGGQRRGS